MNARIAQVVSVVLAGGAFAGAGVLEANGITVENLQNAVISVLQSSLEGAPTNSYAFASQPLHTLSPKVRTELVVAGLDAVKSFLKSAEVRKQFAEAQAGTPPEDPRTAYAEIERSAQQGLKEADAMDVSFLAPADRKDVLAMRDQAKKATLASLAEQKARVPALTAQYEKDKAAWVAKTAAPDEKVNAALKQVLTRFLSGTDDMPWTAQLTVVNGRKLFADKKLRAKPAWWTACFRAGREPVEAGRAYAKRWLAELK